MSLQYHHTFFQEYESFTAIPALRQMQETSHRALSRSLSGLVILPDLPPALSQDDKMEISKAAALAATKWIPCGNGPGVPKNNESPSAKGKSRSQMRFSEGIAKFISKLPPDDVYRRKEREFAAGGGVGDVASDPLEQIVIERRQVRPPRLVNGVCTREVMRDKVASEVSGTS